MARNSLKNIMNMIEDVKGELEPQQAFLSDLERSIELDEKKNRREPSKTYKPSGMNCMRESYYLITGTEAEEEQKNYSGVGICNAGSDIHERIQKAISGMVGNGIACSYVDVGKYVKQRDLADVKVVSKQGMETKLFHKSLNMSFLCDGIINYKNHYYIVEIKSETTNKFWNRKGVDPGHYMQAQAYSTALGIDEVIFIYVCRDNLQMKSFMYNVTPEMKKEVLDYVETCNGYIAKKQVPPKNEAKAKCMYCSYQAQCRKDG